MPDRKYKTVYRVETRDLSPDDVDYWDFVTEGEAKDWMDMMENQGAERPKVRILSDEELADTAVQIYIGILDGTG